jgi:hypothetical protein
VCDWLVTVNVRGTLVVSVTLKIKGKRKWEAQEKATTRTKTITAPTIIIIIIIIIIKRLKTVDTDNRGKKMRIIFCLYQYNFDKQLS